MGVVSRLISLHHGRYAERQESLFATGLGLARLGCLILGTSLAFAAARPMQNVPGTPARILASHMPAWLAGSLVIALAAAALSLLASLLPMPRRKDPEDFALEPLPPPKGGWVAGLVMLALLLIGAAGAFFLLHAFDRDISFSGNPTPLIHSVSPLRPRPLPSLAPPPQIGIKAVDYVVMFGAGALTFAALAFAAWMTAETRWRFMGFGGRRKRRGRLAAAIADAVDGGIAELGSEADPRRAVIACYQRCEAAVTSATNRRYPWQTQREYLKAALEALLLPATPVAMLLSRFEWARFGNGPVSTNDRDAARTALETIRAALREKGAHGNRR